MCGEAPHPIPLPKEEGAERATNWLLYLAEASYQFSLAKGLAGGMLDALTGNANNHNALIYNLITGV